MVQTTHCVRLGRKTPRMDSLTSVGTVGTMPARSLGTDAMPAERAPRLSLVTRPNPSIHPPVSALRCIPSPSIDAHEPRQSDRPRQAPTEAHLGADRHTKEVNHNSALSPPPTLWETATHSPTSAFISPHEVLPPRTRRLRRLAGDSFKAPVHGPSRVVPGVFHFRWYSYDLQPTPG